MNDVNTSHDSFKSPLNIGDLVVYQRYASMSVGIVVSFTDSGNPRVAPLKEYSHNSTKNNEILVKVINKQDVISLSDDSINMYKLKSILEGSKDAKPIKKKYPQLTLCFDTPEECAEAIKRNKDETDPFKKPICSRCIYFKPNYKKYKSSYDGYYSYYSNEDDNVTPSSWCSHSYENRCIRSRWRNFVDIYSRWYKDVFTRN